ncbi:c-type cytochrome biogenesis protein CcmI [Roseococcus sp. YIM B11640]|uniref:c-type cytochrome biogenesis protein CcmI n=1 Tax=Roseococcus sp. YIM B11640 TaxID=3133973 RepID=UPI003C7C7493
MTWLALAVLAAVILSPLAYALLRPARARGRAEADLTLYRAQLAELDTQLAEGRLDQAAHAAAVLEVQRRLLAAPADAPAAAPRSSFALLLACIAVPVVAVFVYLDRGYPGMPSATLSERRSAEAAEDALLRQLRARLAHADPATESGRQGFKLLGNAERGRGNLAEAAAAWERALSGRMDLPLLGDLVELQIQRGEAESALGWTARGLEASPGDPRLRFLQGLALARADRRAEARSVWQSLLADAPADAPWRRVVQEAVSALPN